MSSIPEIVRFPCQIAVSGRSAGAVIYSLVPRFLSFQRALLETPNKMTTDPILNQLEIGAGSVSVLLQELQRGDAVAVEQLWNRYFQRLVEHASKKLRGRRLRSFDEEDIAAVAFEKFVRGAKEGRFPQVTDRDDLWKLLLKIASDQAIDRIREERTQSRGAGKVRGESVFETDSGDSTQTGLDEVSAGMPTPEFAAQITERLNILLEMLPDSIHSAIAIAKLEGYTNQEIAVDMRCSLSTVNRRLSTIRQTWAP